MSIRFRSLPDESGAIQGPKYLSLPGEVQRIFNPGALKRTEAYVCITEGELDAVTATMAGLPAVGLPGAKSWQPWFSRAFRWYQNVYVLQDNDDSGAGEEFADQVAKQVKNVSIVPMPSGHDVNSWFQESGAEGLRKRIGL